jgi:hypothetical protein
MVAFACCVVCCTERDVLWAHDHYWNLDESSKRQREMCDRSLSTSHCDLDIEDMSKLILTNQWHDSEQKRNRLG